MEKTTVNKKTLRGVITSDKMQDTAVVSVSRYVKHPKYKKFVRQTKKYLVHDSGNTALVGDKVEIAEVRPISKRKHFTLLTK